MTNLLERLGAHIPVGGTRMSNKTVIVSGAGAGGEFLGIGAATAILFAAQGAAVGLLDIDGTRAQQTLAYIEALGGRAKVVTADVTSEKDCQQCVGAITREFGGLDVLINNVAIAKRGSVETVIRQDWQATFDVNATGTLLLSQASIPCLLLSRGAIINVSTIAAHRAHGVAIAYASSKAAIEAMTRDMACTLGPRGVRVNCLVPGMVHTPMGSGTTTQARELRRNGTLLNVEGSAWDLAWAALFLASEEARWVTGISLPVDAGSTLIPSVIPGQARE